MFDIVLYNNVSQKNVMEKVLNTIRTVTGTLRDECDMIYPVVMIELENVPATTNYMYISQFGRYYFVDKIVSVRNGLWRFECTSDPLMSFKTQIKNCVGIVKRAEKGDVYNMMLNDGALKVYSNPHIITKKFPTGFTGTSYVLAVAGSASSSNNNSENG